MSLSFKKNLVTTFLAVMMVWPLLHIGMAKRYHLNPWKLFGYGMYSRTPIILDRLEIGAMSEPGGPPVAPPAWTPAMEAAVQAHLRERKWWGDLAPPVAVAKAALRDHPELYGVAMRITRLEVNPKTSHIEATPTFFKYPRHKVR